MPSFSSNLSSFIITHIPIIILQQSSNTCHYYYYYYYNNYHHHHHHESNTHIIFDKILFQGYLLHQILKTRKKQICLEKWTKDLEFDTL